jgi:hypothetical protein
MNIDITTVQPYLTFLKDLATLFAAVVAAWVAIAWKKQFTWKIKYDLAQRLLKAVYKVRLEFAGFRDAIVTEDEIIQATEGEKKESNTDHRTEYIQSQNAVYNKRWQKTLVAVNELQSISLEAEAVWGKAFKDSLEPLVKCAGTLYSTVAIYLAQLDSPITRTNNDAELRRRQIMYSYHDEKGNFFTDEINEAVGKIEKFLKPYLKI